MENKASAKSIMLNYGLILGLASVGINVVVYALGMHYDRDWKVGILGFLIMVAIIVMGIKKFRGDNDGLLSFGQAVKVGVGIAVISSVIGVVYNLVFINFIEPDYMTNLLNIEKAKWIEMDMPSDQMEMSEKMFNTFSGPALTSAIGIVAGAFFGFVISAIAGAIMKRSEQDA